MPPSSSCPECERIKSALLEAALDQANAESRMRLFQTNPELVPDYDTLIHEHAEARRVYRSVLDRAARHRELHGESVEEASAQV